MFTENINGAKATLVGKAIFLFSDQLKMEKKP